MPQLFSFITFFAAITVAAAEISLEPDYTDIELPPNIAPLNFRIRGVSNNLPITAELQATNGDTLVQSADGHNIVQWPLRDWHTFIEAHSGEAINLQLKVNTATLFTATNRISNSPIDAWLSYRLIEPSYRQYNILSIRQRKLTDFSERMIFSNRQTDGHSCINCHTYNRADPSQYLFHTRAFLAGTQIVSKKHGRLSVDFTDALPRNPTYPAWHPSGDFIAFSVNETRQSFYEMRNDRIEVFDLQSDLVLFSLADRTLQILENTPEVFETYPTWSPDGRSLFTARARTGMRNISGNSTDRYDRFEPHFHEVYYDLVERTFDPQTRRFSPPQMLIDAKKSKCSITLPRVSPDGRWIVLTVGPYGCFHIWHRESDLWLYDRQHQTLRQLDEINSPDVESYHTFSSDGNWMVFSSRRDDGAYTRPYFTSFDARTGKFSKPFLLPAQHPDDQWRRMYSYNLPEFSTGPVKESPRELRQLVCSPAKARIRATTSSTDSVPEKDAVTERRKIAP